MSDLWKLVEHTISTRRLFARGQRILVAVSGGVDSMVLLHVLHKLASKQGWRLTVAHLNHQLRGRSSDGDERLVRRTAGQLGLAAGVERAKVREYSRAQGLSLEMAARKLRHDFLARTAARLRIRSIALAHHADDQIELFFLRLLRGSGGEGLAGMKWRSPSPGNEGIELVRPLLDQPKSALREYAAAAGVRFREDSTNALLDIQRNRIRHELLPLLRKQYQPALDKTVLRVMEIVGAEADYVTQAALRWLGRVDRECARNRAKKSWPEDAQAPARFDELPLAVQRRSVQLQLLQSGVVPDFDLVERLRAVPNKRISVGPRQARGAGIAAKRWLTTGAVLAREDAEAYAGGAGGTTASLEVIRDSSGVVTLRRPEPEAFNTDAIEIDLDPRGGEAEFGGVKLRWHIVSRSCQDRPQVKAGREFFDADRVGARVTLRHWRPGDRFHPIGMSRPVKLQDLLTNLKVPRSRRRELALAESADGQVFWVEGLRISDRFKLSRLTIRRLQWCWERL